MATPGTGFPAAAIGWIAVPAAGSVLAVGLPSLPLARRLGPGRLTLIDRSPPQLAAVAQRMPRLTAVAAVADAIPFPSGIFEQVVVAETLHTLAPRLALAEFARVLRPGGTLAVVHTARDDSVPWVRRLAGILRRLDPDAMSDASAAATEAALHDNTYFPMLQRREFRRWAPAGKPELLAMVERAPGVASAPVEDRQQALDEVGELYDAVARPPEPLLLPYTITCWRGTVDHSELSAPLGAPGIGLRITL